MKIPTQKVRRKADGEVCTVNAGDYDRALFEELSAPKAEKVEKPADRGRKGKG